MRYNGLAVEHIIHALQRVVLWIRQGSHTSLDRGLGQMSDGFFGHPSVSKKLIKTIDDIKEISSVSEQDPWIKVQIEYVKDICDYIGDEVYKYYTVFSPLQYIRLRFEEYDEDFEKFVRLFKQDPKAMYNAAKNIAKDIKNLLKKLFEETKVDGIYYSVQTVQDPYFDEDKHKLYVQPLDLMIMEEILKYTDNIILHICGYGNYTNNLKWYVDYPAKVFNWATHTEGISLAQGKEIFNGKAVLGGFDNNPGSILYNADQFALEKEINNILDEAGIKGVALGADCTISSDISLERLELIKKISKQYVENKK